MNHLAVNDDALIDEFDNDSDDDLVTAAAT
jgi:hypothetical protein